MKKNILGLWRCVIANIMYMCASDKTKNLIADDITAYTDQTDSGLISLDCLLLSGDRTFRNVFYYRLKDRRRLCTLSRVFLPDINEIELYGEIGGGLRLYHRHMVVHTCKAGKNLQVGPGVVLGKNKGHYPTIGDNVRIEANSTIIGGIDIGDNVVIKAGSVVTKNLEKNSVYAGNPAQLTEINP